MNEDNVGQLIELPPKHSADVEQANFSGTALHYVNSVQLVGTQWDIRIMFSALAGDPQNGLRYEARAAVVMSPEHAKALAAALTQRIEQYEKANGVIPWNKQSQ